MEPLKKLCYTWQSTLWIETQNPVTFLRPVRDISARIPSPTACSAEFLRLRKVPFAALQFLSQMHLLSYVNGGAKRVFENLVVADRDSDASNVANSLRSNDPHLYVESGTQLAHPLYGLCHEVAVFRVNGGQVLLERRGSPPGVEPIDLKQFARPIFKKPGRI